MDRFGSRPSTWTARLLDRPENAFMCPVDVSFIRDNFNLNGLDELVPNIGRAVSIVLDEASDGTGGQLAAELLYGLVHARFVMTPRGVAKVLDKYVAGSFGQCPRINCESSHVLPIGLDDQAGRDTVKLYCPRCADVYAPAPGTKGTTVDGAYFGTGLPQMVFMTRPECRPPRSNVRYEARLYGFRVHESSADGLQRRAAAACRRSPLPNIAAVTSRRSLQAVVSQPRTPAETRYRYGRDGVGTSRRP